MSSRPRFAPATARLDVLGDFTGAPATVELVKKYALQAQHDTTIRLTAEEVIQHLGSKDYASELLAVYHFVLRYTRYANDPRTVELVKKPGWVAREIANGRVPSLDCEDLTAFIAALCLALGREVRVVTVAFDDVRHRGERQYSHIFAQIREPRTGRWVTLDPVAAEDTLQMLSRIRALKIWPVA